jgi:hypothetical protein
MGGSRADHNIYHTNATALATAQSVIFELPSLIVAEWNAWLGERTPRGCEPDPVVYTSDG